MRVNSLQSITFLVLDKIIPCRKSSLQKKLSRGDCNKYQIKLQWFIARFFMADEEQVFSSRFALSIEFSSPKPATCDRDALVLELCERNKSLNEHEVATSLFKKENVFSFHQSSHSCPRKSEAQKAFTTLFKCTSNIMH